MTADASASLAASEMPDLSVVVCTHNRAPDVRRLLMSLAAQVAADGRTEVIVVDNASTDDTRATVHGLAIAALRYVFEGRVGLCHARNAGWRQARAPIVAFVDDDAIVEAGWLAAVRAAFRDGGDSLGCVGGRIIPDWEAPRPAWLADRAALVLTMLDWSPTARPIEELDREWLAGANIAFRREVLVATGGFHPALDRVGNRLLSSGDVFLEKQVQRLGYTLLYHPAMCVRHRVPPDRLTKAWFRRRYFWQGVSDAVMEMIESSPSVAQRLASAVRRMGAMARTPQRLVALVRASDDPRDFEEQCWTLIRLGHIAGLLGLARATTDRA